MRLEYFEGEKPTKWYDIDIIPLLDDNFSVVITYGLKNSNGEDSILMPLKSIYIGDWVGAEALLQAKVRNREKLGYKLISIEEPE